MYCELPPRSQFGISMDHVNTPTAIIKRISVRTRHWNLVIPKTVDEPDNGFVISTGMLVIANGRFNECKDVAGKVCIRFI
jgi:hypothetical protein